MSSTQATTGPDEVALEYEWCLALILGKVFNEGTERAQQWLEESRPRVTREEFLAPGQPGCPDPVFDEHWDQGDEDRLQQFWNESRVKAIVENLSDSDMSLQFLWRTCIRMMRIDPFSLLKSELRVAAADHSKIAWEGIMISGPMWSDEVCRLLSRLISHPFFSCALPDEKLRFYLKWAVICRTDDRRPLKTEDFTPCPIVRRLIRTPSPGKQPWRKVHETFRMAYWEKYGGYTVESSVLHAIAESTPVPYRPERLGPRAPYDLCAGDITQVLTALDRLSSYGFGNLVSSDVALEIVWMAHGGRNYPVGDEEFREVVGNCWLADNRRNMKRALSITGGELGIWEYYGLPEKDVDLDLGLDNESSYSSERPERSDASDQVNDAECLDNGSLHDEEEEGHDEDEEGQDDEGGLTDDGSSSHEWLQICPRCCRSYHRDEFVTRAGNTKRFCNGCTRAHPGPSEPVPTSQALAEPAPTGPNDSLVSRQEMDLSIRLGSAPELDSAERILQVIDDLDADFAALPGLRGGARLDL
ncbi:hypothetical protein QQZ08_008540 [Neonectria magnoliae]|uniref:Uncharacterized protein n=1 Tax=Neonectria magnoliae TaxID=2732573 RepID=A0ABR1HUL7_9HYPO